MTMIAQRQSEAATRLFSQEKWQEIAGRVAEAFRLTTTEERDLEEGMIPRLIAAIPFLAGCDEAERTAVAHLGSYLLSVKETKAYFNAHEGDTSSPLERLRLISGFKGGDPAIAERGLCLLALNMVADYKRDIEEDARLGKFNPIAAGAWDFESTVEALELKIVSTPCAEMDDLAPIGAMPLGYWVF